MDILLTGSVAYDYLMTFPGQFKEHILPERLASIRISFLVDSMFKQRVAPQNAKARNIAFDVTPHRLVTGIVTENGVVYPPFDVNLKSFVK